MATKFLDYGMIGPSHEFLMDEAVLYQAWRKSVAYIRRHNWYADVLELDLASLDTRRVIAECSKAISSPAFRSFSPAPMRIVPVPKRGQWTLKNDTWSPEEEMRWRPLAHISVKDQTLATAAMICLANLVETEQGDTRSPAQDKLQSIHRRSMSNYGNRLYCVWQSGLAGFQWGNSNTYREYFEDYRSFVARPGKVAQEHRSTKLAIVNLDIERFYDCIQRDVLVTKLQTLAAKRGTARYDDKFFECLTRIFRWEWDRRDKGVIAECVKDECADGIPQGLVAGGFFANAYMLEFDRQLRRKMDDEPTDMGWTLVDFCRYVDDMRLVIRYNADQSLVDLKKDIVALISRLFEKHAPGLRLNVSKTDVLPLIAQPSVLQVAATMESLQTQVSGPLDPTSANQVLATLNALFPLAEQAATRDSNDKNVIDSLLTELQSAELDVRPDTVERFAANRWRRVYRILRSMTDRPESGTSKELRSLDEKAGLFARTLIRRWVTDPSNVRLLRVAFDVVPDAAQLDRYVLALLEPHCFLADSPRDRRYVAWYTLSELLKAGATETGFVRDPDELSASSDVVKYRERLREIAERCQQETVNIPWYLLQQSALFLLVHGQSVRLGSACGNHYRVTMNCIRKKWKPDAKTLRKELPAALRSIDLGADKDYVRQKLVETAAAVNSTTKQNILRLFDNHVRSKTFAPPSLKPLPTGMPILLDDVLNNSANPFSQENAATRLAERLLEIILQFPARPVHVGAFDVAADDWASLQDPSRSATLNVTLHKANGTQKVKTRPKWCPQSERWRLDLAVILTKALRQTQLIEPPLEKSDGRYKPVRAQRTGMLSAMATSRAQLGDATIPVSPWMEELLMHLGKWPGFEPYADLVQLPTGFEPEDVLKAVGERLAEQDKMFGSASQLPVYEVPIKFRSKKKDEPFTVMLVQTAIPKLDDFKANGTELAGSSFRRRHRRHLSSVLKLILQTIETRKTYAEKKRIDLIILPELSVHPSDMHLIRLLIAKTRAWVFCGLVFHKSKPSGVLVNRGTWLIPTFKFDGVRHSRRLLRFDQGKHHLTDSEVQSNVKPSRDCQWVITGRGNDEDAIWRLSASICYDSTDLKLGADLRDITDGYIVSALNKDVPTFDNMIAALHYHMFQHVVLVNSGEFGGSSVQAPYVKHYVKNRVHAHGSDQVVISICEMRLLDFRYGKKGTGERETKTPPAGFSRGKP